METAALGQRGTDTLWHYVVLEAWCARSASTSGGPLVVRRMSREGSVAWGGTHAGREGQSRLRHVVERVQQRDEDIMAQSMPRPPVTEGAVIRVILMWPLGERVLDNPLTKLEVAAMRDNIAAVVY